MAFTREQTQQEFGGMNNAHLADTIMNPAFDADARRYGVEMLIDRKATEANRPLFRLLVSSITAERAAAAAKAAQEAEASQAAETQPSSAD
jgi:hypothetical protein